MLPEKWPFLPGHLAPGAGSQKEGIAITDRPQKWMTRDFLFIAPPSFPDIVARQPERFDLRPRAHDRRRVRYRTVGAARADERLPGAGGQRDLTADTSRSLGTCLSRDSLTM
ncbi:hypothetical protein MES5069_80001 [Mesorhizobium escarrei]|uniref:Uncharacterized protein n=1 Tax=Mesorhizobium escarrei TaxID=666018 RepID=A0ABM9EIR7_9HYPH|nr:hypothetical protein MES5069_80001 [Mesorhizobium escarrei]